MKSGEGGRCLVTVGTFGCSYSCNEEVRFISIQLLTTFVKSCKYGFHITMAARNVITIFVFHMTYCVFAPNSPIIKSTVINVPAQTLTMVELNVTMGDKRHN